MANRALRNSKNIKETIKKLTVKAVYDFNLIEEGDSILIAVSGGKDSTVLAMILSEIKNALKINYTLSAVHISSDFCSCCQKPILRRSLGGWGIPFTDISVPIIGRLKPGRKMNCYWCSTQRRAELLDYAVQNGFNKIALGHHLDDIIETFFMNLCQKGSAGANMKPLLKYDKYPVSLIRPLAHVEEKQIIECAGECGILNHACTCPFGAQSKRRTMRARLAEFTGNSSAEKRRIARAVNSL
jgi:tRNA 2-thiocytidine biosynthesis protein TtcA